MAKSTSKAEQVAQQLGQFQANDAALEAEIKRLRPKDKEKKPDIVMLDQVRSLHEWLEGKRDSRRSCRIVGESRTGKTFSCDIYRLRHKPHQEPGKPPVVPVVFLDKLSDNCTPGMLFTAIIEYLRHRMVKGTIKDMSKRAFKALGDCGVEMLIIDEADRLKRPTLNYVRDISDHLGIAVVLVGTDRLDVAVKRDEQVYNRFRACYRYNKLSGREFEKAVKIWEKQILKLPVPSNLHSKTMLTIIGNATGGYLGLIDELLREAAVCALKKGLNKIDKATLQEVANELI